MKNEETPLTPLEKRGMSPSRQGGAGEVLRNLKHPVIAWQCHPS